MARVMEKLGFKRPQAVAAAESTAAEKKGKVR
jgi:hypothetical protein